MAASTYAEVLAWLYTLEAAKGMDFKLERVTLALRHLGDPQRRFAAVHIAGTNGKGSVAAMLHALFSAGGYRVGLYTSPHLLSFTERIRVGTESIAEDEVVELAAEIRTAATVRGIDLTFFEFITVMAFLYFARRGVELAVVEVGLGGRLDATNVIDSEVAVITTIAMDHEEYLGDTLLSVAREKAGIIKPGRPVIVGQVPVEVEALFEGTAAARGAVVYCAGRDFGVTDRVPFRFQGMGADIDGLVLPLLGAYQRQNAATAIAAAVQLRRRFPLSDAAMRGGLLGVRWPGRLEIVHAEPLVVVDGAHNADGIAALVRELPAVVGRRAVHVLFGVMRDKRWQPMIDALAPIVSTATLATTLPPRGETPAALAQAFARHCPVTIAADPVHALDVLVGAATRNDAILVTGSLFLIGAVYPYFLKRSGRQSLFAAGSPAQP